ncbi:hypothetical protein [Helicobacter pylori]|uniref:hypothetical protein n=1 Tax=Helicobacter pylori TaxID=210 RepID=UPI0006678B89|nr:hypothetical protein [Helicobacter pylori]KMT69618.1 hypothetical protein AB991_01660 [Helicobacter pylori]KNE16384.1 hypothetical protein ACM31_02470 [Helicobacter pylori]KNX46488.1 hypothetical protein AEY53_03075 [Helicobacter pylori]KNX47414.1 hypothetical protein AEY52_01495 [Helicobacter pylori]MCH4602812.1 hypothetical protein [Helicobacter pylori]
MFELGFFLFLGLYIIINSIYLYKALNSTKQSQEDFMNKHSELLESLLDDVSECKKRLEILEQKSIKELKQ